MAILSDVAPGFFAIVRDVFRDDAFMGLARLTDKTKTFGNSNLSLATLVELAESSENRELATTAKRLFDQLYEQVRPIREWRDKWLAHTDYDQALLVKPLPEYPVQRGQLDRSIGLAIEFMNLFAKYLDQPFISVDLPIVVGDADVLARSLETLYDTQGGS